MKKRIKVILSICVLSLSLLAGCGRKSSEVIIEYENKKPDVHNIVCTDAVPYDWVTDIMGEDTDAFNLSLVLVEEPDGYEASSRVKKLFDEANIIIYQGDEDDEWVETLLADLSEQDREVIKLIDVEANVILAEEAREGMDSTHSENCDEVDNNIYFSFLNVDKYITKIWETMNAYDNNINYEINYCKLLIKLHGLRTDYARLFDNAYCRDLILADNDSLAYLFADIGKTFDTYYPALPTCSKEKEVSKETIQFLAEKVDNTETKVILVGKNSGQEIAKQINEATMNKDCQILTINTLRNISAEDIAEGFDYIESLRANIEVLKEALKSTANFDY